MIGLIGAWTNINRQFRFNKHVKRMSAGFSSGGYTGDGYRYAPARVVHRGEYVIRKPIAQRARPFLVALNDGQPEALQATGGARGKMPGYARGAVVANTGGADNAALMRASNWAKKQHNKPYIWGGVGPRVYDCSGFMSAITNVLTNINPHMRLFATSSFANGPTAGFARGLKSAFSIGVKQGSPG